MVIGGQINALWVLTAIHDVMKVAALAPIVDAKHCTEWSGYKVGDAVLDHDAGSGAAESHATTSSKTNNV
eukprot:3451650-Amphidinium_carterae.1